MAAMLSAVDDSVGEIFAELERLGLAENTFSYFQSDNGPSRETRNWLDGTQDPYYGGTAGKLKGHKFSLYEGGIRSPGIMHNGPQQIPTGQVISEIGRGQWMCFRRSSQQRAATLPNTNLMDSMSYPWWRRVSRHPTVKSIGRWGKQTAVRRDNWKTRTQRSIGRRRAPRRRRTSRESRN